jgi:DNA-binding NarL/FixJ family response regulator
VRESVQVGADRSTGQQQDATASDDTPRDGTPRDGMSRISVVIVDDEAQIRKLLRALLDVDPRFEVVGEAGTVPDALEAVAAEQPDVVLLDLLMGGQYGGDAIPRLVLDAPETMVLVLSALSAEDQAGPVFAAGAFAYLEKSVMGRQLPEEIAALRARFEQALAGETVWAVRDPARILS